MGIEVFFEDHKPEIERNLQSAQSNVKIAVAWINFKTYFIIFEDILKRGSQLEIICSDNRANRSHQPEIEKLIDLGAEIKLLKMLISTNHMHHKFALIDDNIIINGSFNWSSNAMKSFENIMVIYNEPDVFTHFHAEFEKLKNIESSTVKSLQKRIKCPSSRCKGSIYNMLIFSKTPTKYNEAWGDIVAVCTECDYENIVASGIQDNSFNFLFDSFDYVTSLNDEAQNELLDKIDRDVNKYMTNYINASSTIHAIGFVKEHIISTGGETEDITEIVWKNKYVGDDMPDSYQTNFGIIYE